MDDIHSCSYYCQRPACVLAQRDELRDGHGAGNQAPPPAQPAPETIADHERAYELLFKENARLRGRFEVAQDRAPLERFNLDCHYDGFDQMREFVLASDHDARVHDLETICDPAGIVTENALLKQTAKELVAMVNRLKRDAAQPMYAGDIHRSMAAEIRLLREQLAQQEPVAWINVADRMPESGKTVLAYHKNSAGHARRIRAMWVAAKSHESGPDSEIGEYDEDDDCYYDPQGWYERIEHWVDYTAVAVCGVEITHWMPMPAPPIAAAQKARS